MSVAAGFMLSGFISMVGKHKHLMNMLISLEFMMMGVIMVLLKSITMGLGEMYLFLILFTFIASEGALGLSIIVSLIRTHGSDYFLVFNVLKC